MSIFGNYEKDDMYDHINRFLENYKLSELMYILQYCMESYEYKVEDEKKEIIEKVNSEKKELINTHLKTMSKNELIELIHQSSCKE